MNIVKLGFVLLTGAGFGFGVDKLADTTMFTHEDTYEYTDEDHYGHMGEGCHDDDDFLEHMLDHLSDEDVLIVESKIDELLDEYGISIEELYDDDDIRYDFMNDLMVFFEENDIDYHLHGDYDDHFDEDDDWHSGMGMH